MSDGGKQAVVVIHGIGEQRPMRTVRSFVEAVWTTDETLTVCAADGAKTIWLGPDARLASNELVRITTNRLCERGADGSIVRKGARTDFYELYWQHLMGGNRWSHVLGWARPLLFRRPARVPVPLRNAWWTAWILLAAFGMAVVDAGLARTFGQGLAELLCGVTGGALLRTLFAVVSFVGSVLAGLLLGYIGDAARYLDDAPGNVAVRQAIRAEGIRLLKALHASGEYDRIVVVGHSLGSVVAYDVLRFLWAETESPPLKRRSPTCALARVESAAEALREEGLPEHRQAYLEAQAAYANHLRRHGNWCVTDLVTLGSPLTHAALLLADDADDFAGLVRERGLSVSPPVLERVDQVERFTYRTSKGGEPRWQAHHAAVFGAVRWTNLYFPYDGWWTGDLVGGPVGPLFGRGVVDIPVRSARVAGLGTHVHHWTLDDNVGEHVVELRRALDLGQARLRAAES